MYSKKKYLYRKNKVLSKKRKSIKKPIFRLYAKKKFVKYSKF